MQTPREKELKAALEFIRIELSQHTESSLPRSPIYYALNKARDTLAKTGDA